jgi:hypothetical protein
MKNELGVMWEEAAVPYFNALSRYSLERTEVRHEKLCHGSRCPRRHLNRMSQSLPQLALVLVCDAM